MFRISTHWKSVALLIVAAAMGQGTGAVAQDSDGRLEAIGALSASHVYFLHGYIGTMADGFVEDVYSSRETHTAMEKVATHIGVVVERLNDVVDSGVSREDERFIDDLLTVYQQLQHQSETLSDYTRSDDNEDLEDWSNIRDRCWKNIQEILDL